MVRAVLVLSAILLASCTYKDAGYENGDLCGDGADNDGDGFTDCDDGSCDEWCAGDTDTDTDTDSDTDTDTDSDTDTDTDTDTDSDTGTDTVEDGGYCEDDDWCES